jgi:catechol-2,3-dioxygenase
MMSHDSDQRPGERGERMIDHVALYVSDLDQSRRFYEQT